jgi:hypothetical protein
MTISMTGSNPLDEFRVQADAQFNYIGIDK